METSLKSPGVAASYAPGQLPPTRDGSASLREVVNAYMGSYTGRDTSRTSRLSFWVDTLGDKPIGELIDDDVQHGLDILATRKARYYCGKDADGRPIFKALGKTPSGATLNRYQAALASVLSWAHKRRLLPRAWVNPCKTVEKAAEPAGRLRFLDASEIDRLLSACRAQKWDRLHLIVLAAITTGCRRGELERLTWADIDVQGCTAAIRDTKNGEPRTAPLTDAVIAELAKFSGKPDGLIFASRKTPSSAMNFEAQWHAAMKAAGIRGFTFHGLRHTAASVLAMSGASLHDIGQVLGHKTIAMSARYAHLSTAHKRKVVIQALGNIGKPGA